MIAPAAVESAWTARLTGWIDGVTLGGALDESPGGTWP